MEIDHNRWYINGNRGCVATNAGLADGYFPQGSLRWDVPERGMREDRYRKIKVSSIPFLCFSLSPLELASDVIETQEYPISISIILI